MVKQKIQDNLSVLERDCVEVLSKTDGVIQSNKKNKARMQKVRSCLVTEYVCFVLGLVRLRARLHSSYLFLMVIEPDSQLIQNDQIRSAVVCVG